MPVQRRAWSKVILMLFCMIFNGVFVVVQYNGVKNCSMRRLTVANGVARYDMETAFNRRLMNTDGELTPDSNFEMNGRTGSAIVIFLIMAALANSAGIGGGLFWVPLFNALLQFPVKYAAALSQSCVAAGTVGASCFSIMQRNPIDKSRPMIDYSLSLVLMPALVLGMSIGVLLNIILPNLIISAVLLIILLVISFRTLQQGWKMRKMEKKASSKARQRAEIIQTVDHPADDGGGLEAGSSESPAGLNFGADGAHLKTDRASVDEKASLDDKATNDTMSSGDEQAFVQEPPNFLRHASSKMSGKIISTVQKMDPVIPWIYVVEIFSVAVAFLGLEVGKSFFSRCSWEFFTMLGAQVILTMVCSALFIWLQDHPVPIRNVHADHRSESEQEEGEEEEDIEEVSVDWDSLKLCLFWILMLVLGVISGTVGLGGGVMISPLLLELKVHPQTAAATSTLITFFASTTATVAFGLDDRLNLLYMAVYAPLCLVGGFFGVFFLTGFIKRYKMASSVSLLLGVLVLLSAGLVAGFALREAIEDLVDGNPLKTESLCDV